MRRLRAVSTRPLVDSMTGGGQAHTQTHTHTRLLPQWVHPMPNCRLPLSYMRANPCMTNEGTSASVRRKRGCVCQCGSVSPWERAGGGVVGGKGSTCTDSPHGEPLPGGGGGGGGGRQGRGHVVRSTHRTRRRAGRGRPGPVPPAGCPRGSGLGTWRWPAAPDTACSCPQPRPRCAPGDQARGSRTPSTPRGAPQAPGGLRATHGGGVRGRRRWSRGHAQGWSCTHGDGACGVSRAMGLRMYARVRAWWGGEEGEALAGGAQRGTHT
jgi:hypothetical protein